MKKSVLTIMALCFCASVFAQGQSVPQIKWYGFVRSYFAYDTRESNAGTEDLYFYMPKDQNMVGDVDLNAIPSFRFAALTSRLGLDILGYEFDGYKIGGKIEADFYSGVSGVTGTATFRLRQAFTTVSKDGRTWKIGQAWHPMAADLPDIFSLESGAPFGPFSRTPQVTLDTKLYGKISLTASAIWQMQYTCTGPDGASANYIKYGCTPELYFGLNYKSGDDIVRLGANMVSIKPRNYNATKTDVVSDRLTTLNLFQYGQIKRGDFTFREKVVFAHDGSHMNMVGGYGVSEINSDGSWEYSATKSLSAWFTAMYKKKDCRWSPSIFLGLIKEFGTSDAIVGGFWKKNSADAVNKMFRIQPEVLYNLGKLSFGAEYMLTAVQYGTPNEYKLATEDLHWVANNRLQALVKFTF